ncbi:MAG: hypothetical protein DWQ34_20035 [Planctomycetota bacterium]|nr:MAG: hypothetical protein DWQ34_20035 [Planctomycetota bacterium]REK30345.1 MAG: hypothetical protein DWQ41_02310 [Planctomycetota bacterium]
MGNGVPASGSRPFCLQNEAAVSAAMLTVSGFDAKRPFHAVCESLRRWRSGAASLDVIRFGLSGGAVRRPHSRTRFLSWRIVR